MGYNMIVLDYISLLRVLVGTIAAHYDLLLRRFGAIAVLSTCVLAFLSSCKCDDQPPERLLLPGDIIYINVDESGKPTQLAEPLLQLDGKGGPTWDELTQPHAWVVSGNDTEYNAGFRAKVGSVVATFGASGASVTRIGERYPNNPTNSNVHGRAAVRRILLDDWVDTFLRVKNEPYEKYLSSRFPLQPNQRAYYVQQVIYTNAYYAGSADFAGLQTPGELPVTTALSYDRGSFAYFLSADALRVPSEAWQYNDQTRTFIQDNWLPVRIVLNELPLGRRPEPGSVRASDRLLVTVESTRSADGGGADVDQEALLLYGGVTVSYRDGQTLVLDEQKYEDPRFGEQKYSFSMNVGTYAGTASWTTTPITDYEAELPQNDPSSITVEFKARFETPGVRNSFSEWRGPRIADIADRNGMLSSNTAIELGIHEAFLSAPRTDPRDDLPQPGGAVYVRFKVRLLPGT